MAFKEVSDLSCDTAITIGGVNRKSGKANPTQLEGYYLGKKKVADTKKKSGFSYLYILQTVKGNTGLWGRTDLDRKMEGVTLGAMIRVSANGSLKTPTGDMYKYKVEVDLDNTIEVAPETSVQSGDSSYSDSDEDTSYLNDAYTNKHSGSAFESIEEDDSNKEDEAHVLALAAAERRAKVEALLKGQKARTKN